MERSTPPSAPSLPMKLLPSTELFIDAARVEFEPLVGMWPKSIGGKVLPIGASVFGDLFFQRPEGNVQKLDVIEGGVHHAAFHLGEFTLLLGSQYWRDTHLMSHGAGLARRRGLARRKGQFFGFTRHPFHDGRIDWNSLTCFDAVEWHAICAKALDRRPGPTGSQTRTARVRRPVDG
ncbi:hypothetical protein QTH97_22075 [Variovorax sp. J22R24]|uniref:hypothetical protein n=1 Tax=Variovorax gracilis TaxID=3053502 RepID=UPI0025774015|nr:hypothetical protein [Variovorax sp. J22R24]MDM0107652.1 hypothetical protein [Variovorax sp. J22R24]